MKGFARIRFETEAQGNPEMVYYVRQHKHQKNTLKMHTLMFIIE